ncbi:MAG TPA: hypothetical protein VMU06_13780 [Stellaceae bacterium]|nr:hypothetical protein [Stellaceae bacterium]
MNISATALSGMTICEPTADGAAIVFSFKDANGKEHVFACDPQATPEIVMKFTAAREKLARQQGEVMDKPGARGVRALIVERAAVASDELGGAVILRLHATETSTMDFALSPRLATDLAKHLRGEIAKLQRTKKKNIRH